jgi:nucleoid DNA-binding protein
MDKTGLSKRKAEKAVNAVFAVWRDALANGEPVELPGGTLQAKRRRKHARRRLARLRDIQTHMPRYRLAVMRERAICFRADPELDLELPHAERKQFPWIGRIPKATYADPAGPLVPEDDPGWNLRYLFDQVLGWVPPQSKIDDLFVPAASGSIGKLITRLQELSERGKPLYDERLTALAISALRESE